MLDEEDDLGTIRRVTTAVDAGGRSRFSEDAPLQIATPATAGALTTTNLWVTPTVPADIDSPASPPGVTGSPPRGGLRYLHVHMPPRSSSAMHQTQSIDFVHMLSGEVCLLLDSGDETVLKAGDALIQRGTVHKWENRTAQDCDFVAVMVSADLPERAQH